MYNQPPQYGQQPPQQQHPSAGQQYQGQPQQAYPQQQAPQQHQAPAPYGQQPVDLAGLVMPDNDTLAASHKQAESEGQGRPNQFKVPPPPGRSKWSEVPVNTVVSSKIWFCPAYEAGRPLDHLQYSHFVMTRTCKGTRFRCDDSDDCVFCKAYKHYEAGVTKAQEGQFRFLKRAKERLYNVINLDNEATMQMQDGTMRPLLANFAAPSLHATITGTLQRYGSNLLHPQRGAPWKITKTKHGPNMMNVMQEAKVLAAEPLPQHLWSLCMPQALWKLHALVREADNAQKESYLRELGFPYANAGAPAMSYPSASPVPQGYHAQMQQPMPYAQPAPQPQSYPPLQQQPAPQQVPQPSGPYATGSDVPQPAHWQQPQPQQAAQHPLDQMPQWAGDGQPQQFSEPPPQKYQQPAPTQGLPPAPAYGAYSASPAPAARQLAPGPVSGQQPRQLTAPLPGDIQLPDSRERCFGKHDPQSHFCSTCPEWIITQCAPQTPKTQQQSQTQYVNPSPQTMPQSQQGPDPNELQRLQNELAGMQKQ